MSDTPKKLKSVTELDKMNLYQLNHYFSTLTAKERRTLSIRLRQANHRAVTRAWEINVISMYLEDFLEGHKGTIFPRSKQLG